MEYAALSVLQSVRRPFLSSGSRTKQLYSSYYDDNGVLSLVPDGEKDVYAEIQSHARSCDISLLVDRYLSGDSMALSRAQGFYGDVSSMPKNFAEAMTLISKAEDDFSKLPKDIKASFGNDYRQFLSQVGSPSWFEKMGMQPQVDISQPRVAEDLALKGDASVESK